jgi:hypothetical protein
MTYSKESSAAQTMSPRMLGPLANKPEGTRFEAAPASFEAMSEYMPGGTMGAAEETHIM